MVAVGARIKDSCNELEDFLIHHLVVTERAGALSSCKRLFDHPISLEKLGPLRRSDVTYLAQYCTPSEMLGLFVEMS